MGTKMDTNPLYAQENFNALARLLLEHWKDTHEAIARAEFLGRHNPMEGGRVLLMRAMLTLPQVQDRLDTVQPAQVNKAYRIGSDESRGL
jgi:hypothetical protein